MVSEPELAAGLRWVGDALDGRVLEFVFEHGGERASHYRVTVVYDHDLCGLSDEQVERAQAVRAQYDLFVERSGSAADGRWLLLRGGRAGDDHVGVARAVLDRVYGVELREVDVERTEQWPLGLH